MNSAGQLIDHWIRCLDPKDEELSPPTPDVERKLLDAAKVLGFDDKEFPVNGSNEQKREALRRWEKTQERSC